jgi:hypothetical protein
MSPAWLAIGALAAGGLAFGVGFFDSSVRADRARTAAGALAAVATRTSELFDATVHAARLRLDSVATAPMLRAAIGTDTATVADLVTNEMLFTANAGESLEVFQLSNDTATSLLRIPKEAAALPWQRGREAQGRATAGGVTMVVSAPVAGYGGAIVGGLMMATPVDLAPIRRSLEGLAERAALRGLGGELQLIGQAGAAAAPGVEIEVPASGEWTNKSGKLVVTLRQGRGLAWATPARYMFAGLAVLLMFGFFTRVKRR